MTKENHFKEKVEEDFQLATICFTNEFDCDSHRQFPNTKEYTHQRPRINVTRYETRVSLLFLWRIYLHLPLRKLEAHVGSVFPHSVPGPNHNN